MRLFAKIAPILLTTLAVGMPVSALSTTPGRPAPASSGNGCGPWQIVPVPSGQLDQIAGIDGVSGSDFWAVEDAYYAPHPPTMLHWDGTGWSQATVEGKDADLKGVDVISATDAWAVGTRSSYYRTETFHWDGSVWTEVPVPSPERSYDILYGVSAIGSSDVWAAGVTGYARGLIVHWDGTAWSAVPNRRHSNGEEFRGISAVAPDDAWAVGGRSVYSLERPLIEHWDGATWSDVPIPQPEGGGLLMAVSASGPDDAWAAGFAWSAGSLIYHWDGATWTRLDRVPYRYTGDLRAVSDLAPDDVWVAGLVGIEGPPIAAHWDGSNWTVTPLPVEHKLNQWLLTINAFTHTSVWAGGGGAYGILGANFRCH